MRKELAKTYNPADFEERIYSSWVQDNCFAPNGRVFLTNHRGGIAVADGTLKIIAKLQVKGVPCDYKDGHILTTGKSSFWLYCYSPSEAVRIYRIFDSSENPQSNA